MGDPGNFQIRVTYFEQREHIKRVTPNKKDWQLDKPAIVYIQHGRAVGLRPEDSTLEAIALSASNNRDDLCARQVLREAHFYPIDQQGKQTRHESNLIVTVVTGPPGPPEVPPAGQGPCIVRGRVTAEPRQDIKTGLTTYLIPEISLEKDVGTESGRYRLKFDSPGLEPYFKTFDFTTDLERQQKIRRLNQELNPLRQEETEAFKAQLMAKDKVDKLFLVYEELEVIRGQMQTKKQDARMLDMQKRVLAMELELKNILGNRA
eukprot:evm.model.NODE_3305_length_9891_cov_21.857750.2